MIVLDLKTKTKIENIKKFRVSFGGGMLMYGETVYEYNAPNMIKIKPSGIPEEEAYKYEVEDSFHKKLEEILRKYHVEKWDGFNKSNPNVLDGSSFYFNVELEGKTINAYGYMSFPKDFNAACVEIAELFDQYVTEEK